MIETEKPFSPSCERNQDVVLQTLKTPLRPKDKSVLEIGSGTGQHAVYFGKHIPHITWQTADVKENHAGINMWLEEAGLENVLSPLRYRIVQDSWPTLHADVVFNANVVHIISESLVEKLINDLGENMQNGQRVIFYGPFKYEGQYTSPSNADFDVWLKDIDPSRGIRDIERIESLMKQQMFNLVKDIPMPAHNQFLIFEKQTL